MNQTADINSIDQILEKIKKAINEDTEKIKLQTTKATPNSTHTNSEILELTNIIARTTTPETSEDLKHTIDEKNFDLLSKHIQNFTQKLNTLMKGNYIISEKEVREIFKETLRPYLKSWLNNNLEDIVKEILEIEIKKIFKKII